ncbi:TetR/AcrR family transcriptional regulator [Actinomadura roseirufa]|uniref:TetR/AcrR family transcriptional regulator n=1 Tax=Actinomadura roseirufa TaxID=2094049 RepID=UPI001A95524F|nr:TetR/AcrR family transcriptional regulator [Actinomadura roseirufa]
MTEAPRALRADAQRNRARILDVARTVVEEHGTQASLRDIARRAEVGMGTLYRHFATREELLEALLGSRFERLAAHAEALEAARGPQDALLEWVGEFAAGAGAYRGLAVSMMATLEDSDSSLHQSCARMRAAGGRLLRRAQRAGHIRADIDETDLFVLVSAVASITDSAPSIAARRDHLFALVLDGLVARPG